MENLSEKLKHLPGKPGVYMMKDEREEIIYVGKAASLRSRVRSYFQKGHSQTRKVDVMMSKVHDVDWLVTDTELEALMLECNLIKRHRPKYNVLLRDDKHYPYICVTITEPFPRVKVVRRIKQDGNKYYGPFADAPAVRQNLRLIRKAFRIRSCNKKLTGEERDRPCLNLHMNQCDSPCSGAITTKDYAKLVRLTIEFLEGHKGSMIDRLHEEMEYAAEALEFERAARLRDQIGYMRRLTSNQKAISSDMTDQDVIAIVSEGNSACVQLLFVRAGRMVGDDHFILDGVNDETLETSLGAFIKQFYRDAAFVPKRILVSHMPPEFEVLEEWLSIKRGSKVHLINPKRGEKLRLVEMAASNAKLAADQELARDAYDNAEDDLQELQQTLDLSTIPSRIEAYDISNIQGREAVGSMVVFKHGMPAKAHYRRFKIRSGDQPDDYGMMREVLLRRFAQAREGNPKFTALPDLILIDGGRGQLNSALEAMSMSGFSMPVVSLAKRLEEIYVPSKEKPILLPRDSRALKLLQRVRDEAHRFAIAYHHKLREKTTKKSVLESIPGIGAQRRKALIKRFGSLAGVRRASLEELKSIPGMTETTAITLYNALNE